jgi:hypothetical protein
MSNFEYVSHEEFPEDPYIKELVYLLIDGKYRVAYVRKQAKNGGMFWGTISAAVTKYGVKTYYESFLQDSSFLEKDIKRYLDERGWEKKGYLEQEAKSVIYDSEVPF